MKRQRFPGREGVKEGGRGGVEEERAQDYLALLLAVGPHAACGWERREGEVR